MHHISANNVNDAFAAAWWYLRSAAVPDNSRNGRVWVAPGPVMTTYQNPTQRVLFNAQRDANPVFHLVEAVWMLAGENSVRLLQEFAGNIANYAEPDGKIHGAYGYRWRRHFFTDQLHKIGRAHV